jgi:hypothetical protein
MQLKHKIDGLQNAYHPVEVMDFFLPPPFEEDALDTELEVEVINAP